MSTDNGRELIALDWLYTRSGERLHHATLTDEQYEQIDDWRQIGAGEPGEELPVSITLTCGRVVDYISIPGIFSRMGMTRCQRCCDRLGYPHGKGSPKNDRAIRRLLGLEVADA